MKKLALIIATVLLAAVSIQAQSGVVIDRSGPYYVGDKIGFNKICHDFGRGTSTWDFGDGTTRVYPDDMDHGWQYHSYSLPGTYLVKYTHGIAFSTPMCGVSMAAFTETRQIKIEAVRGVTANPSNPKVDQLVYLQALNFIGSTVSWNFGDGTVLNGGPIQTHRYQSTGVFTVSVREIDIKHDTISTIVTVSPDDRFIQASAAEVMIGEPLTFYARNFNGDIILWNFGDGTVLLGGTTISHVYDRTGEYRITAVDEAGESRKTFETSVKIFGLSDDVLLEVAELSFQNGKYYSVVSKNSRELRPLLRLKMRGTGAITGHWLIDGAPYGLVSTLSRQGEVKEITMDKSQALPTIEPGLHTVSFRLTRPAADIVFPTLKYYVLPHEMGFDIISPPDGFVAKEDEIPVFSWAQPRGGAAGYQIAFSSSLFEFLDNRPSLAWTDVRGTTAFTPGKDIWDGLKRNHWTYWRIRALDSFNKIIGESGINEIKIVVATAEVSLDQVTDLEGNDIGIGKDGVTTDADMILVKGHITYRGESEYLILQVFREDSLVDQLLFRDVRKDEPREFETSVPSRGKGKILFRVLKSSSPSVIVGIKGILIR